MLLEEAPESTRPVKPKAPHFKVFPEFNGESYAERYNLLLTKLVRARLSPRKTGVKGAYREPNPELSFRYFATSLLGRAVAVAQTQPQGPAAPPKIEAGAPDNSQSSG
jgi:hypothetical protein